MKKVLLVVLLFFISTSYTYSSWYGNHAVSYSGTSGILNCDSDGDTTGGTNPTYGEAAVAENNSSSSLIPHAGPFTDVVLSGNLRCLQWDDYDPEALSVSHSAGWLAFDETINVAARDTGGSGVDIIELQESQNSGPYVTVQTWSGIAASNGALVNRSWLRTAVEGIVFQYRIVAHDRAGNSATYTHTDTMQFDIAPLDVSDIGAPIPADGANLLATNSQNISIVVDQGPGNPITLVKGYFEDYTSTGSFRSVPFTSNSNIFSINPSIQDVDNDESPGDGEREYSLKITEICDLRGCITAGDDDSSAPGLANYTYNVFSDTSNISQKSVNGGDRIDLEDTDNIADGAEYDLRITLQDQYGNDIIPVSSIGRQIDFSFDTFNDVYINQFTRTGDSGVLIAPANTSTYSHFPIVGGAPVLYADQVSTDGDYDFGFRVYAPTHQYDHNHGADPSAQFFINGITVDVSHSGEPSWDVSHNVDNSSGIDFSFGSMFRTQFSGDLIDTGFVEGTTQSSSISVSKNSARSINDATSRKMYFKYNGNAPTLVDLDLYYGTSAPPSNTVSEGPTLVSDMPSGAFNLSTYNFYTRLEQLAGTTVDEVQSTFLSSHLSYTMDGFDIVTNGGAIGRDNYYDAVGQQNTNQAGIKILGISSSDKTQEFITGQFTNDVRILGKLTKSSHKRDIRKKAFDLVRNVTTNNGSRTVDTFTGASGWDNGNPGVKIVNNSILYFGGLAGDYVQIGDGVGKTVYGNKTIIIVGGDAYITSDFVYNNNATDMLGLIVIEDSNGNGGNIYIHPDVIDMVGTLYADKSILTAIDNNAPYGAITEIEHFDGNSNLSDISNQLYIFGSIFSENTIGGSRAVPIECPYYVINCADSIEAQKYDLNYLRRYVQVDTDGNGIPDTNAGSGSTSNGTFGTPYEGYPLVVEYNSLLQSSPPPLFK